VEDLPDTAQPESYGELGRIWVGGKFGLKAYPKGGLDSDALALIERVLDTLRANAGLALELRNAQGQAARDREHYEQMGKLERQLRHASGAQTDLANSMGELVERLSPKVGEATVSLAEPYLPLPPAPPGKNVAQGPGMTEPSPEPATPAR
jgi:hypothetical protein